MRKTTCLLLFLIISLFSLGQDAAAIDSMKTVLANAKTVEEKVDLLDLIARMAMNINLKQADEYGKQLVSVAEESRDRKLMIKAYMSNGVRFSYFAGVGDYTDRSIEYFNKALAIAKQNQLNEEIAKAYLKLSTIHLAIPDKDKALHYVTQASSILSSLKNDSLLAEMNNAFGDVYLNRNDKILALRYYLTALRIADDAKKPIHSLIRTCYLNLHTFYKNIEDYDRAIDYHMEAYKRLDLMKEKNVPYFRAVDMNNIGRLYSLKKSHDIAISYFEKSLAIADSLKFSNLKVPGYTSLLNQYIRMDQPQKALEFFNSASGRALKEFLQNFGLYGSVDLAYGVIYTELNKLDSARYYFTRAIPVFEKNTNEGAKINFYAQLAPFYKKTGEYDKAIALYLQVKDMADKAGQLEVAEHAAKYLDTLYNITGNYRQASLYSSIYYKYKDSLETLNKEKELAQIEAADEQYRLKKAEEEKAEKTRRKNNIQYMGITIGIAALFVMLVVLGMFKVSANTIRAIGFFAFLLFFEFIFLIFKKNIYSITHGEPLKDLAFMIGLAALLVPFHHWMEHRVIKYLTSHNRLTASGKNLMGKVFVRKKTSDDKSNT